MATNEKGFVLDLNPAPFISDAEIDARLQSYISDPARHCLIEYQTAEIKKQVIEQADEIARDLALFGSAALRRAPSGELQQMKPSSLAWVQ
jgi:hypothetical protein